MKTIHRFIRCASLACVLALTIFIQIEAHWPDIKIRVESDVTWAVFWTEDFRIYKFLGSTDIPDDGAWRQYILTHKGTLTNAPSGYYVFVETVRLNNE